jgi:hypothetical protein
MGGRLRRAYRRASVRRLCETRGQTTVEWLVAMVLVTALAAGLVAALPATAGAILDRFGCLVGKAVGVAIDGDHVWVTSSDGYVYLYSMADIKAADGATVQPQTRFDVPASAYLTVHDGRLYVGSFHEEDPGSVYSMPLGADGEPSGPPVLEATAPPRSQGLAVTDDGFVFSTSWGARIPASSSRSRTRARSST